MIAARKRRRTGNQGVGISANLPGYFSTPLPQLLGAEVLTEK
jgi:hypothetical protein